MSTRSETWPQADSTDISTGSDLGTWAEDNGDFSVVSNHIEDVTGAATRCVGRDTGGVTTADHKVTAVVAISTSTTAVRSAASICRKINSGTRTHYQAEYSRRSSDLGGNLAKVVANTLTALTSRDGLDSASVTCVIQAVGDQISGSFNGVSQGPVTDTAISSHTWGGFAMRWDNPASQGETQVDTWSMEDVGRTAKNTRSFPLGVNVGMGWRMGV